MTDTTTRPISAADQRWITEKRFQKEAIWLPKFAVLNFNAGNEMIRDVTFEECLIEGPGLIAVLGETVFDGCNMGVVEDSRSLLVRNVGPKLVGGVGFMNCRFVNCRFVMIGFAGDSAFIDAFSASVANRGADQ